MNWDSFKWRNHQPDIGRFFNVDPLAEKYVYNSPYAFSENHVTSHGELEGLEKVKVTSSEFIANQKGRTLNTGGQLSSDKNVYNKNFDNAPNGGDFKEAKSEVETSNGKVLSTNLWEQGDGPVEEFVDMFTGDPNNFDNNLSGQDTKGGSKLEGNIEGAKFNVDISINKDVMTFTSSMSGGDKNKAYSLRMGEGGTAGASFVIGSLKSGREKGTTNATTISIKFTVDKDGNAKFDFSQRQDLTEKDKNRSTSNEKK